MKKYTTQFLIAFGIITIACIFIETPYMIDAQEEAKAFWKKIEEKHRQEWIDKNEKEIIEYLKSKKENSN